MRDLGSKHAEHSSVRGAGSRPSRGVEPESHRMSVRSRDFLGNFTRIRVHATEGAASPLALIDCTADEREADRVADRLMASAREIRRPVDERGSAGGPVPADVNRAASSQGRPVDPAAREFMESRLGHDFSTVRVHTDASAVESARALRARAYTVGSRVFFNAGEYSPSTEAGRRLLAHELAHVLQQRSTGSRVQRQPQGGDTAGPKRTPPGPGDHSPEAYEAWLKAHPRREYLIGGTWEPDVVYNRYTPQWFREHGYVYAGRGGNYPYYWFEVWLNSAGAGKEYRVWRDSAVDGKSKSGDGQARQTASTQNEPASIDPNANRTKLFGRVIAAKHNVEAAFGDGDTVLYEDGTVELSLRGTTQSYVFRPIPGGMYIVYGPDGKRLDKAWDIPESDLPDPYDDAVP
jgi:Domain of unknown function (DUF4157)